MRGEAGPEKWAQRGGAQRGGAQRSGGPKFGSPEGVGAQRGGAQRGGAQTWKKWEGAKRGRRAKRRKQGERIGGFLGATPKLSRFFFLFLSLIFTLCCSLWGLLVEFWPWVPWLTQFERSGSLGSLEVPEAPQVSKNQGHHWPRVVLILYGPNWTQAVLAQSGVGLNQFGLKRSLSPPPPPGRPYTTDFGQNRLWPKLVYQCMERCGLFGFIVWVIFVN